MLVIWGSAITAFLVCLPIYVRHARAEHLYHGAPPTPIFPITATCVVVIFVVILLVSRSYGQQAVLMSAAIGAAAAPMIFEFPFDLIVMTRTYPPLPPDPALYRVLFFAPVWALFGFAFPSAPAPYALNVLSKILAFVVTLSLFLPQRAPASTPGPAANPPATVL